MMNSRMVALGMTARVLGVFMACTAALAGAQAGSSSPVGTESNERTIEDGGTGSYKAIAVSNSSIAKERFERVGDEGSWKKLWAEHTGMTEWRVYVDDASINFDAFMVVAYFRGPSVNTTIAFWL